MNRLRSSLRFTLGELALLALAGMLGLAALKIGDWLAAATMLLALLLFVAMAVVAVAADSRRRIFAVGFLTGSLLYGLAIWTLGDEELDPARGELLTTRAMEPLYEMRVSRSLYEMNSGDPATVAEVAEAEANTGDFTYVSSGDFKQLTTEAGGRLFEIYESPTRQEFMRFAHVLFGLLTGYAAGKLASALYRRRSDRGEEATAEPAS